MALTAYHAHTARIIDPYVDMLLVGDSLGMVMHGYETTVPVPLDLMIMHAQAVVRGSTRALVVVDMPFGSYEESPAIAFRNAARVLKETGCGAIKIEGGAHMAETIRYLTERGIPVMSHIGMTPQAVNMIGSFKPRGRTAPNGRRSRKMPARSPRPAPLPWCWRRSPSCSPRASPSRSQFQLSASGRPPSATGRSSCSRTCSGSQPEGAEIRQGVRAAWRNAIETAVKAYADDVRSRAFPAVEHTYPMYDDDPQATKKAKMTGS